MAKRRKDASQLQHNCNTTERLFKVENPSAFFGQNPSGVLKVFTQNKSEDFPGDLGFDPLLGAAPKTPK